MKKKNLSVGTIIIVILVVIAFFGFKNQQEVLSNQALIQEQNVAILANQELILEGLGSLEFLTVEDLEGLQAEASDLQPAEVETEPVEVEAHSCLGLPGELFDLTGSGVTAVSGDLASQITGYDWEIMLPAQFDINEGDWVALFSAYVSVDGIVHHVDAQGAVLLMEYRADNPLVTIADLQPVYLGGAFADYEQEVAGPEAVVYLGESPDQFVEWLLGCESAFNNETTLLVLGDIDGSAAASLRTAAQGYAETVNGLEVEHLLIFEEYP